MLFVIFRFKEETLRGLVQVIIFTLVFMFVLIYHFDHWTDGDDYLHKVYIYAIYLQCTNYYYKVIQTDNKNNIKSLSMKSNITLSKSGLVILPHRNECFIISPEL